MIAKWVSVSFFTQTMIKYRSDLTDGDSEINFLFANNCSVFPFACPITE